MAFHVLCFPFRDTWSVVGPPQGYWYWQGCPGPVCTEEGPCLDLACCAADLASFQSPHPLKIWTPGALPSSVRTRLRGGPGAGVTMHLKLPQLKAMCPPPFLHASLRLDQPIERPLWIGWFVLKLYSQPLGPPGLEFWEDSLETQLVWSKLAGVSLELWRVLQASVSPLLPSHLSKNYLSHKWSPRCPFLQEAFLAYLPSASI